MNDAPGDPLLSQLARRAAERDRADQERDDANEDPRLRTASRPLDSAARARIVQHLTPMFAELNSARETEAKAPGAVPLRGLRASWRWALPLAAALVAVFSTLAYRALIVPGGSGSLVDPLPTYTLRVAGAVQSQRGGDATGDPVARVIRLAPGNRLQVMLTPQRVVATPIAAYALVSDAGGERAVDPAFVRVSDQGAVRLDALLGPELEVIGDSGRLVLVFGDPGALPVPALAASASAETGFATGRRWRAFVVALEIDEPP